MRIMYTNTIVLVLFATFIASSQGHFLWQQRVWDGETNSVSTFFTFAEKPGIENAENKAFATMAYDKGVQITASYDQGDNPTTTSSIILTPKMTDEYITASLPATLPDAYALEGYCEWGLFSEKGPPSLLRYYTNASRARKATDIAHIADISKNKFRVDMDIVHHTKTCKGQGNMNGSTTCVTISVVYDGSPLPQADVMFMKDANSDPTTLTTDADGKAHISVQKSNRRVYARVGHKVDTPGTTANGDSYDVISNYATSVLEISSSCLEPYPLNKDDKCSGSNSSGSDVNAGKSNNGISVRSIFLIIFASFIGSILGSIVSRRCQNCRYQEKQQNDAFDKRFNLA